MYTEESDCGSFHNRALLHTMVVGAGGWEAVFGEGMRGAWAGGQWWIYSQKRFWEGI